MKCQDIYEEAEIMEFPNAVVTVHRPILTSEERERRMKLITAAAFELCLQAEKTTNKEKSACPT